MTGWTYQFTDSARRQLRKLDRPVQRTILQALEDLLDEFNTPGMPRRPDVKKLAGREREWRLRTGEYRIVFTIENGKLLILVLALGHRREIYRD